MKNFKKILVISALSLAFTTVAQAETFEIIVKHKSASTSAMSTNDELNKHSMTEALSKTNLPIRSMSHRTTGASDYTIVKIEASNAEEAKALLENSNQFSSVDIVPQMTVPQPKENLYSQGSPKSEPSSAQAHPLDQYYSDQKGYMGALKSDKYDDSRVSGHNFEGAWEAIGEETRTVRVGVADSGFLHHRDISYTDESADFMDDDNDAFGVVEDFDGTNGYCSPHGNGVSSGIAAIHDDDVGIVGGAKNVEVIPAKVMNCGMGGIQFADAVRWFAGQSYAESGIADISEPVDVINLSLGGRSQGCMPYVQESINYAVERGIAVVVAAGNIDIPVEEFFPANCDNVITVSATNWQHDKADFSNYGDNVSVSAQGVDILGYGYELEEAEGGPGYAMWWEGTSNAAPQVVAAIANVISEFDDLTHDEVSFLLKSTSNNFAEDSTCIMNGDVCGAGSLNAYNLFESAKRLSNGELGYIKHSLADETPCDAKMFIEQLGESVALCELYTVSFNELAAEKTDLSYKAYRVTKGGDLSLANTDIELFIDTEYRPTLNLALTAEELDNYDYGYITCTAEFCSETIIPMVVDATKNAECP